MARVIQRRSLVSFVIAVVTVVVVLALALGLGLGLGLKHSSPKSTSTSSNPGATSPTPALLQPPDASNFTLNMLTGQPPQTRVFNFTLSQVQGAPDGVSRPMLAVNSKISIFPSI